MRTAVGAILAVRRSSSAGWPRCKKALGTSWSPQPRVGGRSTHRGCREFTALLRSDSSIVRCLGASITETRASLQLRSAGTTTSAALAATGLHEHGERRERRPDAAAASSLSASSLGEVEGASPAPSSSPSPPSAAARVRGDSKSSPSPSSRLSLGGSSLVRLAGLAPGAASAEPAARLCPSAPRSPRAGPR